MPNDDEQTVGGGSAHDFADRTAAAEQLPLDARADAFAALHDELRTRLESGGSASA
ncbi:hypothetical protein [Curtobacterium sp. ISL-83]|uniref:hypothetical protein n=1 Tax=Curtobacterium sp. ISL-83 TaxID=2819145 RepID=UPI001BE86411|nr:hypothetical protein [Curtobacterium sp. ISL-83]MBT2503815.1 hypothetical protein [Curtobacterium sp. ISL-83]